MSGMKQQARDVGSGNETDEVADRLSNMSIDSNKFDKKAKPHPGQSLLTQMAPSHSGATISSSNTGHVDRVIRLDSYHVRRTVIHVPHVH